MLSHEPAPHLRAYARRLYGFHDATGPRGPLREGPGAEVVVLVNFGSQWRIGDATEPTRTPEEHGSFAAGLRLSSVLTQRDGVAHGMQLSLTPPGAYAFFGVPMRELAERTVALDDLLGSEADRLTERLVGTNGWPARFALLEAALSRRLPAGPRATEGVVWAWRRLSETHGSVRVEALAAELGWSRARLLARFREEVGIAPKTLARLLRFERAADLLASADRPSLASVAAACGYYDQSHLTGEFGRIAATTPARYAASA